jgi:hypothetical protein
MSLFGRHDPGNCPICDAPHCSCRAPGPIAVVQLPHRDAARMSSALPLGTSASLAGEGATVNPAPLPPPALGDGSDGRPFSTATYRGRPKR